jgi:hypothetical protein
MDKFFFECWLALKQQATPKLVRQMAKIEVDVYRGNADYLPANAYTKPVPYEAEFNDPKDGFIL